MESCHAYSQAWNLSFASTLLHLPRELRDMVYAHIWTEEFIIATAISMVSTLEGVTVGTLPHVVDPKYVGPEVALEVVEAYYRHVPSQIHAFDAMEPEDIISLVSEDVFHVGLDPATVLREMNITFDMDSLNRRFNEGVDVKPIYESLASLLKVSKKKDFKLNITLEQKRIRLNLWDAYFVMLKPILHAFEVEGAQVRILWSYSWTEAFISRELNDLIKDSSPGWKADMVRSIDSEEDIEHQHRHYLWENETSYDPDEFFSDDDEGFGHSRSCGCRNCMSFLLIDYDDLDDLDDEDEDQDEEEEVVEEEEAIEDDNEDEGYEGYV